jgi:cyclophilin family peptidyl-prolyl cis-trans isomerase
MKQFLILSLALLAAAPSYAQTIATFNTSVGKIEVELFDDKPNTTSNFLKYASSGAFSNMFVQRWETNFVIQGGGYVVTTSQTGQKSITRVTPRAPIPNEYSVGRPFSNTFGTLAMARQSGAVNSATSQWFFNLRDNSFLDDVDQGFTVFGRTISGQAVLQRFIPPVGTQGIYRVSIPNDSGLTTVPVLDPSPGFEDLIYVNLSMRRDFKTRVVRLRGGTRQIVFESLPGATNTVQVTTTMPPLWRSITNIVATTTNGIALNRDPQADFEAYRIKVDY